MVELIGVSHLGGAAHGRLGRIHRERGTYDSAMEHLRGSHALFSRPSSSSSSTK